MMPRAPKLQDPDLHRRGNLIAALNRWTALALAIVSVAFVWGSPGMERRSLVVTGIVYVLVTIAGQAWTRRRPWARLPKVVQSLADAAAAGLASALAGGLDSLFWLLLYPHAVAVAVRGGLGYALAVGALDASIVTVLARMTPSQPLGGLHAL